MKREESPAEYSEGPPKKKPDRPRKLVDCYCEQSLDSVSLPWVHKPCTTALISVKISLVTTEELQGCFLLDVSASALAAVVQITRSMSLIGDSELHIESADGSIAAWMDG